MVEQFLKSCASLGIIESFSKAGNKIYVKSSSGNEMIVLGKKGFFITSSKTVGKGTEVYTNKPEPVLARVLATRLLGTTDAKFQNNSYRQASVYPKRVLDNAIEFSTANGKTFIVSTSNVRVTLGLYDLLYSLGGEHSILMMPELYPDDYVKIGASYSLGLRDQYLHDQLISSVGEFVALPTEKSTRIRQNKFLYDGSVLTKQVPLLSAIEGSSQLRLKATETGYNLETKACLNGVNYEFSGQVQIPVDVVRKVAQQAGGDLYTVQSGIDLKSASGIAPYAKGYVSTISLNSACNYEETELVGSSAQKSASYWIPGTSISSVRSVILEY